MTTCVARQAIISTIRLLLQYILSIFVPAATDGQFNGVRDVFVHLMKTEGIRGLYKGFGPVMIRAFVANAFCFTGYEFAMWGLNQAAPDN